ncbi:MAG: hypothetical protein WCG08_06035 [Paludibacter sp.]|jgi:hypothetical protein
MKTIPLHFIVSEFLGRQCMLRLTNGNIVEGIMGNTEQNIRTNTLEVALYCDKNDKKHIPLLQIEALKVV